MIGGAGQALKKPLPLHLETHDLAGNLRADARFCAFQRLTAIVSVAKLYRSGKTTVEATVCHQPRSDHPAGAFLLAQLRCVCKLFYVHIVKRIAITFQTYMLVLNSQRLILSGANETLAKMRIARVSNIFLIQQQLNGGKNVVRGVSAEGTLWLCTKDLFDFSVILVGREGSYIPIRPPLALVANSAKVPADVLSRKFKTFGLNRNDFSSPTATYIAEPGWSTFLSLSGMKDEYISDFLAFMKDAFRSAEERHLSAGEKNDSSEQRESVPEIEALRNRVRDLEEKNAAFEARLKSLEYEHTRLVVSVKREFSALSERDTASETSKELKAYASRLYARSKQLEEQGR